MQSQRGGVIVIPEAKLVRRTDIRPTSETIIWNTIQGLGLKSYRDYHTYQSMGERQLYAGNAHPFISSHRQNFLAGKVIPAHATQRSFKQKTTKKLA